MSDLLKPRRAIARILAWALVLACIAAQAAPAPWYLWASKLDGQQVCRQTSPGAGWERAGGPFRNPRCANAALR